ncbi:unnamed protein product [Oikopleura dioica]|uniref:Cadherin domain-containing protein n=1 Tax=Oikopleura dioica TaxID=34765 RepID=E4YK04_OIKDI|nr:unnamed protein product [Oikopleura dioica]
MRVTPWALLTLVQGQTCTLPTDNCGTFFDSGPGNAVSDYSHLGESEDNNFIFQHTTADELVGYTSFKGAPPAGICFPEVCLEDGSNSNHCLSIQIQRKSASWSLDQSLTSLFKPTFVEDYTPNQLVTKKIYFTLKQPISDDDSQSAASIKPVEPGLIKITTVYKCLGQEEQVDSLYQPDNPLYPGHTFTIFPSNLDPPSFDDVSEFKVTECPNIQGKLTHITSCASPDVSEYCSMSSGSPQSLDGLVTIREYRNLFLSAPNACEADNKCTVPENISLVNDDGKYSLQTGPCDDVSIFCLKATATQNEPADYEQRPFYNYQLLAENLGPWRNGTRPKYATNARFMVEVLDSPDQAPRFNVPPAMVYFKEGKFRSNAAENYITENDDNTDKLLISASDPDLDLNWEVSVVLNELRTTSGEIVVDKFEVDYSVTGDKPAGDESAVYIRLSNGQDFFAECDPESDSENCKSNTPRISNLVLNVLAKEKIPADFFDSCADTSKPCKGMPACARGEEFYMQEQSFDITVFIQDINNNPPRFFNSQSKKYESNPGLLKCSYCNEYGKLEEGNAENTDLTVFTAGNDPHGIFIADIDSDEDNRRFKISIESVTCIKSTTSTNFPCTDAFSVDTATTFQQQLDPVQVTVTKSLNFTQMDQVTLVLKACDEGVMADDVAKCSTFTVNLDITEKNKAPSVVPYNGGMYEYDQSGAYFVKKLTGEEPGATELEMSFLNQNSEQFRSVYFCDIKNSDNQEGIFEIQNGDQNGTKWQDFGPNFLKKEGSLDLKIRLREGEQLNRQEAKSYIYTVRACSLEGDAVETTVADCCDLAGSETRASSRLNITIFDSNINAPLFQIYNGEDGIPYTLPAGSWNVKDFNSPKIFDLSQIQDDDDDYSNTRTCFRIKTSNSNLLNAAEFFDINAISITKKTFKSQITQKNDANFVDEDGLSKIKNNQEMIDGQFHYNFEFTVQACNIDCSENSTSTCETADKRSPFMCPIDLDESTAICSDTEKTGDNSLISEPTGNTMIRFAIQDENEHTPVITVPKNADGSQKTLEIFEKIDQNFTSSLDIRALDGDRCYFGYGRVKFSTTQDAPITVEGGDEFNPDNNKDTCAGSSLTPTNKGASPSISPKIEVGENLLSWDGILKNGQNHLDQEVFYDLTVRAFDGGNKQSVAVVQVLVKDINNHGPTFEDLAAKDKNITIKEGTGSGAQSFCGAVDKDSRAWSADVNKYKVKNVKGYYNDVQKCGPGLEEEVSCDHIFSVTEFANIEATDCSDWVAGRIEMEITADYIVGTEEKGLNREEYDKFSLEIDVEDENCEIPNQNENDCFEKLCHDQCDGVLDENQRLVLTVNVEDINDNGPQIAPFTTAHYVFAGKTESGKDITPQIEVSDLDLGDNKKSSITKISETYICGSSAPDCSNSDFFSVTADPEEPFMKFNLKTLKQIPDINSNNFFAVATITVEVANNEPLYENYDCAYVEKYPEFFKSECRTLENGDSVIFNTKDIIVTVLDDDHVGLVTSDLEEQWNEEQRRLNFKTEMNKLFSDILPLKNPCDCYFDYSTELYNVETQNRPDPNKNDTTQFFTEIDFYVVKTVNRGSNCGISINNCTLPAARAAAESRDLLESTDIAYVLNDASAHEKLKEDQFQIRVSCNMQKLDECEEVYEEEKWTEKEWLILVIAIGGGLSALCAGIIVCMCCMRKRYARKLQSERAMKYDMDDMSSKDAYNESTAYKASGDQHKNQLVGQEGMINIALAYDDDDQQSSIESSHGRASFNSDFDIEEHLNEPQEIYVDSDAEDAKGPNLNALIAGQSSAVSANPLAGKDLDNMSF